MSQAKPTDAPSVHPTSGLKPRAAQSELPPESSRAAQALLARLRSAAHDLEQELSSQTSELETLRQELARAEASGRRHLERLAALEVELQTLRRAPAAGPDQVALQEEQDAFLALLLDDHEQELTALRRERDDALAELALRDHRAQRGAAASAELERLRRELTSASTRAQEAEQARDVALRAATRMSEELARLQGELTRRPSPSGDAAPHVSAPTARPSPPPELAGALTQVQLDPRKTQPDPRVPRLSARAPLKPAREAAPTAREGLPAARPRSATSAPKPADLRTAPQGRPAAQREDNRRTQPARPLGTQALQPAEEDLHLCGPDGARLVPVEDDEPTAEASPTPATSEGAAASPTATSPTANSPSTTPTQPSLPIQHVAAKPPRPEPRVEVQDASKPGSPGSYSMPEDAAARVEVVPVRRNKP
ncbi:MAG: hypothetical protein KIT72_00180 [Polyangiaceae bacterium]|nr:hypothetical protein [Polyangiaceae bacterium]MCW5788812.1 hypothetical protein [Polyangiaceae bacterium]